MQEKIKDDTISRQAAIDALWSLDVELRPSAIDAILNMLNGLPSKQKKGHWIEEPNCWYRCSSCGDHYVGLNFGSTYPSLRGYIGYNYCPNCGADMRGKGEKYEEV